jgi:arabinose-5-phosphate isomerase
MLKELIEKQKKYANSFLDSLDVSVIERVIELMVGCKGMIFFIGVGKSGLVAKKIASTMVSTGTKALFLSPTDSMHGDLGMVSSEDIVVLLSKSGETDELLSLIPALRNKNATLCSVVCNPTSRLASSCQYRVNLPIERELCPFDMAPTMSTTAQLMFGDLLTVAIMQHKKFGLDAYAQNHPAGTIGKRITLRVRDLMLRGDKVPVCYPDSLLKDVLIELSNKRCGCILVSDHEDILLGIFTDGDLRRALQNYGGCVLDEPIAGYMTKNPAWIAAEEMAWVALKRMEGAVRITALPVLSNEGLILGLLHIHDVIQSGL